MAQILQRENNPRLTNIITSRLNDFKKGAKEITKIASPYAETLLRLWRDDSLVKMRGKNVSDECMRFWTNCLTIEYRSALNQIKRSEPNA